MSEPLTMRLDGPRTRRITPPPPSGEASERNEPTSAGNQPTRPRARHRAKVRELEKRGPSALHEILTSIQTKGKA